MNPEPPYLQRCLYCGGNAAEPDHLKHCDGRQGGTEPPDDGEIAIVTVPRHRETSIEAFYDAIDRGTILTRRMQVYAALREIPNSTASETFTYISENRGQHLRYDSNTATRFSELRNLGLIRETGTRLCRITGRKCITWTVVPEAEYVGEAAVHRCATCGQVIARKVPVRVHTNGNDRDE
jgi:hypothetical protein